MRDIILIVIRWYLAYALSYRDIEELMLERRIPVDHSTIHRWVIHYAPLLENEFRNKYKKKIGASWRMDETYIKIKGAWQYFYRAVDKEGNTVDFILSENRDESAAKAFFEKAMGSCGLPKKVTIDKSGANEAALDKMNLLFFILFLLGCSYFKIRIRQIKYLNNIIEQDHRGIKRMIKPMMGFKAFHCAKATLGGIELWRMLKRNQHIHAGNSSAFEQFYKLAA